MSKKVEKHVQTVGDIFNLNGITYEVIQGQALMINGILQCAHGIMQRDENGAYTCNQGAGVLIKPVDDSNDRKIR